MRPCPSRLFSAAKLRALFCAVALCALAAPATDAAATTLPAPILHLTFDQASLADSSPAARGVTGSATFQTIDGRKVATLDGTNQSLTVPLLRSFPDGITIAFWTYAQDGENGLPKNTALGWARQAGSDGTVIAPGWNNTAKRLFRLGRAGTTNDELATPEVTNFLNTWVHWAIVKNPSAGLMAVYRDGQLFASASGRGIVPEFVQDSNTGGANGGYVIGNFWGTRYKGHLDDYRIYDSALDAAQIQTVYQVGAATAPTAFNVTINGTPAAGQTLTGTYQFVSPTGTEGASTFRWYRGATATGSFEPIPGATALTYTTTGADDGRFLVLGVTPVTLTGAVGAEALSAPFLVGTFIDRSLANTVRRLTHDKRLRVVFFGGSITDGAGQNNGLPWRTRTENWFTATYPEVDFTFTNASISGTSSEFGVFRTDRHVLSTEPDLVFVEFAVNDLEQTSDTRTRHTMEGIVRKIRAARPHCDIVFIYTTTRANAVNFYEQGQLPGRTVVHQQIATHYGIPAIDVAAALVAHKQATGYPYRIEFGQPGAFDPAANHYLPDHVHPSNLGHQVYGDAVRDALADYLSIPPPSSLTPHPMPTLLGGHDMTSARILDHTHPAVTYGAGWSVQALGIGAGGRTENFLTTSTASTASPIAVSFRGRELGVYYRRSTTGGQISWSVDAAPPATFPFWHETLASFTSFAMLSTNLGEGNHHATIAPQPHQGHEQLAIAGWLVLDEFAAQEARPLRILPLGDSITYGLYFGEPNGQTAFPYGYRGVLQNLLQQDLRFTGNFEFIGNQNSTNAASTFNPAFGLDQTLRYDGSHQGHPSFTTARTYGNSPGNLVDVLATGYTSATFHPDIVLLHVGINDIIGQGASAASLQADYRALLTKIYDLKPSVELYVSTIMCNHPNHPNYAQIPAFNTWLRDSEVPHWQAQGRFIRLVDMFEALKDRGYNSSTPSQNIHYGDANGHDRIHPNATGYAAMALAWYEALEHPAAVLEPAPTFTRWAAATYSHLAGGSAHPAASAVAPTPSGLPNLLAYALDLDPLSPTSTPPTQAALTPAFPHSLALTFFRARPELTYEVLASSDLASWSVIATNPGTVGQEVTVTDSLTTDSRRFLRLRVTH